MLTFPFFEDFGEFLDGIEETLEKPIVLSERLGYLVLMAGEELINQSVSTGSCFRIVTDSVCSTMRPAAGQSNPTPKASGSVKGQRKRQLTDMDGFVHPPKNKTVKASSTKVKANPVVVKSGWLSVKLFYGR